MPNESISTPAELVAARESQGLSAEDIQRQLKIHIKQLDALERGEWDSLPGLSFVRGMLRSYGRAINVDVEPLLATIGGHGVATDLKSSASLQEPIRSVGMLGFGNGGSGNSWSWLALMAVGIAALALFFGKADDSPRVPSWLGGPSAGADSKKPDADAAQGAPQTASLPAVPALPETGHKLELALTSQTGQDDRLVATISPEPAAGAAQTAVNAAPEIALKLAFVADTWVQLSQSDGRVLLAGSYRAESATEFATRGVVTIATRYPARIKIEFDGKMVPLELPAGTQLLRSRLP